MAASNEPTTSTGGQRQPGAVSGTVVLGIWVVLALAVGGLAALFWNTKGQPTPIADITGDIRKWDGHGVIIQGEVTQTFNLLGVKSFIVRDATGELRVVTKRGLPRDGQTVRVTGIVRQVFEIGGVQLTVLQEMPERERKGDPSG